MAWAPSFVNNPSSIAESRTLAGQKPMPTSMMRAGESEVMRRSSNEALRSCRRFHFTAFSGAMNDRARTGSPLPATGFPFGQFHGDTLGPGQENQLPAMEVHDLVPESNAVGRQPGHFRLQVVDGEADVVVPQPGEVGD